MLAVLARVFPHSLCAWKPDTGAVCPFGRGRSPPRRQAKSGVRRAARLARQVLPPDNAGLAFVTLGVKRCSRRGRNLLEISAFCRVSEESLGKIVFFLLSVW